ncbi:MAG: Ig-like domain-containing protein [Bacillota bacterium]|nr:Ig-like domain-containing protein [Bacillota bacterium]
MSKKVVFALLMMLLILLFAFSFSAFADAADFGNVSIHFKGEDDAYTFFTLTGKITNPAEGETVSVTVAKTNSPFDFDTINPDDIIYINFFQTDESGSFSFDFSIKKEIYAAIQSDYTSYKAILGGTDIPGNYFYDMSKIITAVKTIEGEDAVFSLKDVPIGTEYTSMLPSQVKVIFVDGSSSVSAVTWDSNKSLDSPGKVAVSGTVDTLPDEKYGVKGINLTAEIEFTGLIKTVNSLQEVSTDVGATLSDIAALLPGSVTAVDSQGNTLTIGISSFSCKNFSEGTPGIFDFNADFDGERPQGANYKLITIGNVRYRLPDSAAAWVSVDVYGLIKSFDKLDDVTIDAGKTVLDVINLLPNAAGALDSGNNALSIPVKGWSCGSYVNNSAGNFEFTASFDGDTAKFENYTVVNVNGVNYKVPNELTVSVKVSAIAELEGFDELKTVLADVFSDKDAAILMLSDTLKAQDIFGNSVSFTPLSWSCDNYDANSKGDYIFKAAFNAIDTAPEYIVAEGVDGFRYKINLDKMPGQKVTLISTITSIQNAEGIKVDQCTSAQDAIKILASDLTALDNKGDSVTLTVSSWSCDGFNSLAPGIYNFSALFGGEEKAGYKIISAGDKYYKLCQDTIAIGQVRVTGVIDSLTPVSDVRISVGKTFEQAKALLPNSIEFLDKGGNKGTLSVKSWTCDNFNANAAGNYTFTAAFDGEEKDGYLLLSYGENEYKLSDDIKLTAVVKVLAEIASVDDAETFYAQKGKTKPEIASLLPTELTANITDEDTILIPVKYWESVGFVDNTEGTYNFEAVIDGTISLDGKIKTIIYNNNEYTLGADVKGKVTVIVTKEIKGFSDILKVEVNKTYSESDILKLFPSALGAVDEDDSPVTFNIEKVTCETFKEHTPGEYKYQVSFNGNTKKTDEYVIVQNNGIYYRISKDATPQIAVEVSAYVPVTEVALDNTGLCLITGEEKKINASAFPNEATNQNITWSSSNDSVAGVSSEGIVTAKAAGSAVITAYAENGTIHSSCTLTVKNRRLVTDKTEITLSKGQSLYPVIQVQNGTGAPGKTTVKWVSSDTGVAQVSSTGKITARAIGECFVTAYAYDDNSINAVIKMTVIPTCTSVNITGESSNDIVKTLAIDMGLPDKTIMLQAHTFPDEAGDNVTWSSSNCKIATVDKNGLVTALGLSGKVIIKALATDGSGKYASVEINIATLVKEINIEGSTEVAAGKSITLTANMLPLGATSKKVTWTSSDTSVATVSSSGKVTAKNVSKISSAVITATAADGSFIKGEITITVMPVTTKVYITCCDKDVTGGTLGIDLGSEEKTLQLGAYTDPSDASKLVTWSSNNSKIAAVDENGLVTAIGGKSGKVTITALASDGSRKYASVEINVATLVKEINIEGSTEVAAGKSITLTADVLPLGATSKRVTWTSSDTSVATVSSSGKVTARNVSQISSAVITATAADGSFIKGEITIKVTPVTTKVYITCRDKDVTGGTLGIDLGSEEKTLQLGAYTDPSDASNLVTWSSNNTKVATVDENGLVTVTGLKTGMVKITATAADGSKKAATVTINVAILAKEINITGSTDVAEGKSITLQANTSPDNATNKKVTWSSSDAELATVSSSGKVTAKSIENIETVTITATSEDGSYVSGSAVITVRPVAESVRILKDDSDVTGQTFVESKYAEIQFTAKTYPAPAGDNVVWSVSNTRYATVDENGLVTLNGRSGTVTITATATDGSGKKNTVKITIS